MNLIESFYLVLDLAHQNELDLWEENPDDALVMEQERQQEAFKAVETFIADHLSGKKRQ